ncbi:MAG TPA: hypothetical protein VHA54_07830 [Solirubrobacterales bacterium]|nr:hypothetical protein [Solirubrobacterales bacterium]
MARGLAAGAAGTAAMTAWQALAAKLEDSGGGGESTERSGDAWEEAPAPARVAKLVGEGVFHLEVPAERIGFLANAVHWGTGTGWGAVYGLLAGTRRRSTIRDGLAFGTVVWMASYAQLVPMGIYEPPWKYPPPVLALDLSYHLVYGGATAVAFARIPGR